MIDLFNVSLDWIRKQARNKQEKSCGIHSFENLFHNSTKVPQKVNTNFSFCNTKCYSEEVI